MLLEVDVAFVITAYNPLYQFPLNAESSAIDWYIDIDSFVSQYEHYQPA